MGPIKTEPFFGQKTIQKINAEALIYLGFGWRVMPLVWREKTPLLKSWPNLGIRDLGRSGHMPIIVILALFLADMVEQKSWWFRS